MGVLIMGRKKIDRGEMKKLVEEGLSDIAVSQKLGCSIDYTQKIRTQELGIKRNKGEIKKKVIELLKQHPEKTYSEIGYLAGTSGLYVSIISKDVGMCRNTRHKETRMALDLWKALNEGPKWSDELRELSNFYTTLRTSDLPIRRFAFRSNTIYFKEGDELKAYEMIIRRFNLKNLKGRVARALRITEIQMMEVEKNNLGLEWI